VEQLRLNRDFLHAKYGIEVDEFMQILSYPIVDRVFEGEELREK